MTQKQEQAMTSDQKATVQTLRQLHGMKRLEYVWDYFKLPILAGCILLCIACSILYGQLTKSHPILYIGFVNTSFSDELMSHFGDDFISSIEHEKKDSCYFYTNLLLSDNVDSASYEYAYASKVKLLAAIESKELDIVIVNKEVIDAMEEKEYLYDLSVLLPDVYDSPATAIKISDLDTLKSYGITDDVYLGVIANTPRKERVQQYLNYITN